VTEIKIGWDCNTCVEWCDKNISERSYWIHNKMGGPGWHVFRKVTSNGTGGWVLRVEDEADAIVYRLANGK
jgi:hypothetical protein